MDATVFLGMHAADDAVRIACKNFVAQQAPKTLWMLFEDIAVADHAIWQLPENIQTAYYPFMDALHSRLPIKRIPYNDKAIEGALALQRTKNLSARNALTLATIQSFDAVLFTLDTDRLAFPFCQRVSAQHAECSFDEPLEQLYRASLRLRL